jgi:hypothetical protein
MSQSSDSIPATPVPEAPAAVCWQSWPVRDDPWRALLAVAVLGAAAAAIWWLTDRAYLAVMADAALMLAAWRFFVPAVFEVNGLGVDQCVFQRHRFIPWQAVHRHEIGPDGVLLFPHDDRVPLAAFRSLYVPWTTHRDDVLALVWRHLGRQPSHRS